MPRATRTGRYALGLSPVLGGRSNDDHKDAGPHEPKEHVELSRCPLLLIEDDRNAAEGLRFLFEFDGFSVSVAADAVEGLRLARLCHPQAVICYISLPGVLNGFDVAAVLQSDPATSSAFLVAVTACGTDSDRSRGARVGFQAYLDKPVNYRHLLSIDGGSGLPYMSTCKIFRSS